MVWADDGGAVIAVNEGLAVTALALSCALCRSAGVFRELVRNQVRELLPHGGLLAMLGPIDEAGVIGFDQLHAVDVPAELKNRMLQQEPLHDCAITARWLLRGKPMFVELPRDASWVSAREREEIETYGLGRLAVHGVRDWGTRTGSCLIFTQVELVPGRSAVLKRVGELACLLHVALVQIRASRLKQRAPKRVSPRMALNPPERELLDWMIGGVGASEIARWRGVKLETVQEQMEQLNAKLEVFGRTSRPW